MESSNIKAMRNALKETQSAIENCMEILNRIPDGVEYDGLVDEVADELCYLREDHVKPVLSATPRNCDVGTAEEMILDSEWQDKLRAKDREIAELRECLEQAYGDKIGTYTMKGNEVERWHKALKGTEDEDK